MRIYKILIFFLFFCVSSYAQENSIKNLNIKSLDTNYSNNLNFKLKKLNFNFPGITNKNQNRYFDFSFKNDEDNSNLDITNKSNLVTPTWEINQKFGEGGGKSSKFKSDFYLGELVTQSSYIIIKCRDHEYVDGDKIRLILNGAIIHSSILLSADFYTVDVDLVEGYNNIDFIALNEGESSPNTAQLIVLDEFGKQISNKKWLISTGYKAKLVVFKK